MIRPCCAATLSALAGTALAATCKCGRQVQIATVKRDMRRNVNGAIKMTRAGAGKGAE